MDTTAIICLALAVLAFVALGVVLLRRRPELPEQDGVALEQANHDLELARQRLAQAQQRLDESEQNRDRLSAQIHDLEQRLKRRADTDAAGDDAARLEYLHNQLEQSEELNAKLKAEVDEQLALAEEARQAADASQKESKKLKKEVEDLQDQNDDLEDDNKRLENKVEEARQSLEQSQERERAEKSRSEELAASLKQTQQQRDDYQLQATTRHAALDFVREILTATPLQSGEMRRAEELTAAVGDFVYDKWLPFLKKAFISDAYQGYADAYSSYRNWAALVKKSWLRGKTTVAFVGEFSAGKTSIVNRLLTQDVPDALRLPVSTEATTAIPTYIAGSKAGTSFQFLTPDDELKSLSMATFKRVNKQLLAEVKGVGNLIKYFVMTYANPNLHGLSILDTPGFSSTDKDDAERTLEVINECDALFWVFDVNAGTINRSSIDKIRQNLKKPLFIIINKTDTVSPGSVDKVANLISKTLDDNGIAYQSILRFSSKEPLDGLMKTIRSVAHHAEADSLLDTIRHDINEIAECLKEQFDESLSKVSSVDDAFNLMDNEFGLVLTELGQSCEDAAHLPHFKSPLFGSDRYEMTIEEHEALLEKLQGNIDNASRLAELNSKMINAVQDWQRAATAKNDAQAMVDQVDELQKQFSGICKKYKQLQTK